MASPQPPPGPLGNGNDGPADKSQAASSGSSPAQPVVEILGGDAYAAVVVCALLLLNLTQGKSVSVWQLCAAIYVRSDWYVADFRVLTGFVCSLQRT